MKDNRTAKVIIWTALVTALVIVAPIVAFVQGVNYEKHNSAEIQVKATALVKSVTAAPVASPVPKQ